MTAKKQGARMGRPAITVGEKRQHLPSRVSPYTIDGLEALRADRGKKKESCGQVVDRLVARELRRLRIDL